MNGQKDGGCGLQQTNGSVSPPPQADGAQTGRSGVIPEEREEVLRGGGGPGRNGAGPHELRGETWACPNRERVRRTHRVLAPPPLARIPTKPAGGRGPLTACPDAEWPAASLAVSVRYWFCNGLQKNHLRRGRPATHPPVGGPGPQTPHGGDQVGRAMMRVGAGAEPFNQKLGARAPLLHQVTRFALRGFQGAGVRGWRELVRDRGM
jgi:hypothetical protein